MFDHTMPTFRIDPHRVRDHNRVATRLSHALYPLLIPTAGEWVNTVDDEGNTTLALVDRVENERVFLKLDWGTFQPAVADPHLPPVFGVGRPSVVPMANAISTGTLPEPVPS